MNRFERYLREGPAESMIYLDVEGRTEGGLRMDPGFRLSHWVDSGTITGPENPETGAVLDWKMMSSMREKLIWRTYKTPRGRCPLSNWPYEPRTQDRHFGSSQHQDGE